MMRLAKMFSKTQGYPIRLETVRAQKSILYGNMIHDIDLLNDYYGIFPEGLAGGLYQDLKHLLGSDIASEFRLAFYDPVNPERVYLERKYRLSNGRNTPDHFPYIKKHQLPTPYEFDVFVYFSDRFLALGKDEQARLINGFNFKWFNFSGGNGGTALQTGLDKGFSAANGAQDGAPVVAVGESASAEPDRKADRVLPEQAVRMNAQEAAPAGTDDDTTLLRHFASEHNLLIAAYTDSRKLLERFTSVSAQLGFKPLLWTFSEGFKEIGDSYAGKYVLSDQHFLQNRLSPLDALGYIRNECQGNTMYLLEDFHYYLKRENLSGQEFVELISTMKSMPAVLKRQNSFVVILAPTLELPPEIAPIFGVIRDEISGRRLYYLERFGRDLTQLAEEGKIKPIVGRDREIFACLKVLSQMEANNPILVGKAGVGKTAVVEGLAHMIVKKAVPAMFRNKRIMALNLNAMVSGTKYRGEFETRIEGLVEEVKSNVERIIVFIDEIHTLLGMGATEGSTGAENILKPSLARGDFPCIGATTFDEYRQYIEPDKALARRFQTINVSEPDGPQSLAILQGIKSVYERHYGLKITDQALAACVEMSGRLLPTQCYPGKAIRFLDSVCASASLAGNDIVTPECVAEEFNRL